MLRLTTFGGVAIRADAGVTAEPGTEPAVPRRALALLVLLAAAPAGGVSRDTLTAYLWPESDEEHARSALRQALHTLRRELALPELVLGGVTLQVNPALLASDIRDFDSARAAGELERALACYQGPFLDGFHVAGVPEFERWVERQRVEYASGAARVLETLARGADQRGEAAAAAEWWRRLAALDPLDSRIATELMRALAAAGNPAGALRHAQAHEALMREELGVAPDAAFTASMARIRRGEVGDVRPAERPPERPPVLTAGAPAAPPPASASARPSLSAAAERFRERLERELAGRYALELPIETGRDGTVRLIPARDLRHDRPVTIKVVHSALASQLDIERFLREIKLTARLQHPHILPLLDSGEVGGRPWYATPRPDDAETLRARLNRDVALPGGDAVRLARELADALEHAHSHGVVHRDVSPENVLLAGGHALLTNLGVARALDAAAGPKLTETGMLLGSAAYMSPEQAVGERALDARSDLYSLGAVLFEMLTGEALFSGPTPQAIMAKRAAATDVTLRERLAGVPSGLAGALTRALAHDADERFLSAREFTVALDPMGRRRTGASGGWRRWLGIWS
jgi:serine/threonine protein kinase/DNA-binding SARP family transcriptional activator